MDNNQITHLTNNNQVVSKIFLIRNQQVMIDRDLAELYNVQTKVLNQSIKRNIERFPIEFRFQLTEKEMIELVTNCDRFESLKHSSSFPYVFTEQGIAMLSAVLKSKIAIEVSISIMNAFVSMRNHLKEHNGLIERIIKLENKQLESESKFDQIFGLIENNKLKYDQGVFFDGQVYDAYVFIADLIRSANKSIYLIDNYVDDSILTILLKRKSNVKVILFTNSVSKQLSLDLQKHNSQYEAVEVKILKFSHDRFLIIDHDEVYHIGASLKDLGKKWFAFSKIKKESLQVIEKIKEFDKL